MFLDRLFSDRRRWRWQQAVSSRPAASGVAGGSLSSPSGSRSIAFTLAVAGLACAVLSAPVAEAQDTASGAAVEVHGFGGWAYAETDGNRYLIGNDDGNYDTASLALNVTGRIGEKLQLVGQVELESGFVEDGDTEVELEFAFAQWAFSDALRLRVGRGRQPFGIYGEIFEVGTLRPFFLVPSGIYGPQGFHSESYDGLGIVGSRYGTSGWGFQYDLYGGRSSGSLDLPSLVVATTLEAALAGTEAFEYEIEDVVGGRLNVTTPVEGLLFGVSAYTGERAFEVFTTGLLATPRDYTVWGAHAEWANETWQVRAEHATADEKDLSTATGNYLEVAYHISESWQVASRYDRWDIDVEGLGTSPRVRLLDQIFEHEDVALGVNYWFSPNFVVKLAYHMTEGNRFAFPEDPAVILQALQTNQLPNETDMIVFGGQFSF
jgi:hypothetical protein